MPNVQAKKGKRVVTIPSPFNIDVTDDGKVNVDISHPSVAALIASGDLVVVDAVTAPSSSSPPPGLEPKGPWSVATKYFKRDLVTWQGSLFYATKDIAAGGTNPRLNTDWLLLANGGGEIAYADYQGVNVVTTNSALVDIPGCQIVVPAGSPACKIRAGMQLMGTTTAVNGQAMFIAILRDVVAGATWRQFLQRGLSPLTGQDLDTYMTIEERLAATAVDRTFSLQIYAILTNATGKVACPGTSNVNPAPFIEAVAR